MKWCRAVVSDEEVVGNGGASLSGRVDGMSLACWSRWCRAVVARGCLDHAPPNMDIAADVALAALGTTQQNAGRCADSDG